jgi:hypothetical protein
MKVLTTTSDNTKIVEITEAEYRQLIVIPPTGEVSGVAQKVSRCLSHYEKAQIDALTQAESKEQIWDVQQRYQLVIDVLKQCLLPDNGRDI